MAAITGAASLAPTLAAAERGATVALANKECLVCAGALFMRRAAATGATVLPVDSEHNAIFQALSAGRREDVRRIVLTASGGPFRTWPLEAIRKVTVEQALKHPTWSMGPKVTIDSATLMNKGLELIEAHHLFGLDRTRLDVVVHPQSIVHGLVEFRDGSVIAQLGSPDMRIPISHCLAWPVRMGTPAPRLDLARVATLSFEEPDLARFPALAIARRALAAGGAAPTILNAANEVAVREFVDRRLGFCGIAALVEATLDLSERRGEMAEPQSVDEALAIDHNARRLAADLLARNCRNGILALRNWGRDTPGGVRQRHGVVFAVAFTCAGGRRYRLSGPFFIRSQPGRVLSRTRPFSDRAPVRRADFRVFHRFWPGNRRL